MRINREIKMTRKEHTSFRKARRAYIEAGYPEEIATQYAWDHLFIDRNAKNNEYKEMFS